MERTFVESSTIQAIGYDPDSQTLEVEFKISGVYRYADVPQGEYDGMMAAASKGKYLSSNIKSRYSYTKL
jgi:hypothetical protein